VLPKHGVAGAVPSGPLSNLPGALLSRNTLTRPLGLKPISETPGGATRGKILFAPPKWGPLFPARTVLPQRDFLLARGSFPFNPGPPKPQRPPGFSSRERGWTQEEKHRFFGGNPRGPRIGKLPQKVSAPQKKFGCATNPLGGKKESPAG